MKKKTEPDDPVKGMTDKAQAHINKFVWGDTRTKILDFIKQQEKPWQKMNENEQERAIHRAGDLARDVIMQICNAIASRGFQTFEVTLGKIAIDDSIESKITMNYTPDGVAALCGRKGQTVMLVARDAQAFMGERKKAETDVVGALAMPRGKQPSASVKAAADRAEARAAKNRKDYDPETGEVTTPPPASNGADTGKAAAA